MVTCFSCLIFNKTQKVLYRNKINREMDIVKYMYTVLQYF